MLNNPSYVIEALIVVALDTPTNFTADAGQGEVTLKWTDPVDKYATPEGETAQDPQQLVAKWSHTLVVRNTDHQPESPDDGTVILTSSVRNQYQTNGYVDNTVVNGTPYYYGVFAISTAGVPSAGAFASATPIAGTPLAQLAEGTLIKILENGSPVEFYLAKHSYEPSLNGEGRELVVRKDVYRERAWNNTTRNQWEHSSLRSWLNSTYKDLFTSTIQNLIGNTAYDYTIGDGDWTVSTRSDAVFLLSLTELGRTNSNANTEGSRLPIAGILYPVYYRDESVTQWTRTPTKGRTDSSFTVMANNTVYAPLITDPYGVRPCFTIPSTALVDQDLNLIETAVQTTALSAA